VRLNDPSELILIDAFGSNVPKKVMTHSVPFVKLKVNDESIFNTGGSGPVTTISSFLRANSRTVIRAAYQCYETFDQSLIDS
jgi:hypothetical protein